jgi:hypothetical protein
MSTIHPGIGRLLAGGGGALLIASLFMPWSASGAGADQSGWELLPVWDVYLLITGLFGLAAAITGGRFGFFRRDLSLNGATDIVGLIAAIVLVWQIAFDWPAGETAQVGAYLALVAAAAVCIGAGDFRVRSLFPSIPGDRPN